MTDTPPTGSTSELITLLDRQKAIYHQLRSLSQRQADQVAARKQLRGKDLEEVFHDMTELFLRGLAAR